MTELLDKLHLGCGGHPLPGWLNTDTAPVSEQISLLDVTHPFPFADAAFRFIYTEHMIEHLTLSQGLFMLKECRRVLRPGGWLRVATPDIFFLARLLAEPEDPLHKAYIKWATDTFVHQAGIYSATVVTNNLGLA